MGHGDMNDGYPILHHATSYVTFRDLQDAMLINQQHGDMTSMGWTPVALTYSSRDAYVVIWKREAR